MPARRLLHLLVIGAGAAGLMVGRELARAGKRVTILEARDRCGGRIYPLSTAEFGYPAEGGPEFVHGAAPVTREMMRAAGLSLSPRGGRRWSSRNGKLSPAEAAPPHADRFYRALAGVTTDLPIADFLDTEFAGPDYAALRRSITRTVEGYDAADPRRASTLALREEWMARDDGQHGRIAEGYGAMIDFLAAECRRHGAAIHLGAAVTTIDEADGGVRAHDAFGRSFIADAAILTLPLPLLTEIRLPESARERLAAAGDIGFGNVVKILLRFATDWWADAGEPDLRDLSFVVSDAVVPTWWTQYPDPRPVLTGWYAGPKADTVAALNENELVTMGIASLSEIFGRPAQAIRRELVASRAINWGTDPFARGAYSYAVLGTRAAQAALSRTDEGVIFFSGEALYAGPDIGTVEAALASGRNTAQMILDAD
jgi:monoamine oxidase